MYDFTTIGALIGMALAIILIIKKFHPAYSLIIGALIGGVIGSYGDLALTVSTMMTGAGSRNAYLEKVDHLNRQITDGKASFAIVISVFTSSIVEPSRNTLMMVSSSMR